jgi:hypothetical protein
MAAHRYWRLYITAVQSGGYTSLLELEMYEGAETNNVCSGGTASASSTGFGWAASNAFNGLYAFGSGDGWHSGTNNLPTTPEWIAYDFGSGVTKDITQIKFVTRQGTGQHPKDFALQYSDNGSSWTTLWSQTGITLANTYGVAYFAGVSFDSGGRTDPPPAGAGSTTRTVWRINASAVDGGNELVIADVQMRTALGGPNQMTGGTAFASSLSENSYASANDGNSVSYWVSGSELCPRSWGYKFASAKDIVEVTIQAHSVYVNQSPKDFTIEYWDVDHWEIAHTVTGETGWTGSQIRTYTFGTGAVARPVVFVCC